MGSQRKLAQGRQGGVWLLNTGLFKDQRKTGSDVRGGVSKRQCQRGHWKAPLTFKLRPAEKKILGQVWKLTSEAGDLCVFKTSPSTK